MICTSVGEPQRGLERVGETAEHLVGCHEPVDHDGDVVLDLLLQRGRFVEPDHLAVDDGPRVPPEESSRKRSTNSPFFWETMGLRIWKRVPAGSSMSWSAICCTVCRWMRSPQTGQCGTPMRAQQAHVVVDLGDRADGRARVAVRGLLVDRDGRAQALDEVDVGTVDLAEELAREVESDSTYRRCPSAKMVSNASDDLPEPDRPVKTTMASRGISTSTLRRLCTRAPRTLRREWASRRETGTLRVHERPPTLRPDRAR